MIKSFHQKLPYFSLSLAILIGLAILLIPETSWAAPLANQIRSDMILKLWRVVLALVNIIAILGLIFIALAQILRINLEAYNVRRMLPSLIIALVAANLSHLASRIMVDFAQLLTDFFIHENAVFTGNVSGDTVACAFGFVGGSAVASAGGAGIIALVAIFITSVPVGIILVLIAGLIIVLFPVLLVLLLALMMYVRLYIIWFLVILSPIAFFAVLFEPLKSLWGFWWSWFYKWLLLAPIGFFFLRLAVEVGSLNGCGAATSTAPGVASGVGGAASIIGGTASTASSVSNFATWVFGLGMVFLALYVPYSWGGAVMGALRGMAMRGASLGWRGSGYAKQLGGFNLLQKGSNWQRNAAEGSLKHRLGGLMRRGGSNMLFDWRLAAEARMKAIKSKQADITTESGLGKYVGTPERMATEQAIKLNETHMNIPVEIDWDQFNDKVVSYLKKCKERGELISTISPDLTQDEREGSIVYGRYFNQAINSGSRAETDKLNETYSKAGVDLTANRSFEQGVATRLRRIGAFVEQVPGEGTPQIPQPPREGTPRQAGRPPQTGSADLSQAAGSLRETARRISGGRQGPAPSGESGQVAKEVRALRPFLRGRGRANPQSSPPPTPPIVPRRPPGPRPPE